MKDKIFIRNFLIVFILGLLFFIAGNNIISLTNPDEVFYSQTAREMIQQKTWMVPYLFGQPQFEKPIFTYWCIRLAYKIFGETPFASRFFPAVFALIGCLAIFLWTNKVFKNSRKALFAALCLMSMGMYIGLARTVFTDMIFSVWILLAMIYFYLAYTKPVSDNRKEVWGFFIFSALAVLTKGLLGIVFPIAAVILFLFLRKDIKFLFSKTFFWGWVLFFVIALPWYVYMIKLYGHTFTHEFFYNDHYRRIIEAEHKSSDRWYFYPMTLIGGTFPWSVLTIGSVFYLWKRIMDKKAEVIYLYLFCWVAGMFLIVQVAHSKLASYIFPAFPAFAVMISVFLEALFKKQDSKWLKIFLWVSMLQMFVLPLLLILFSKGVIHFNYYNYLPQASVINFLVGLALGIAVVLLVLILKKKYEWGVFFTSLQVPFLLTAGFMSMGQIEPYISGKFACEYLIKNYPVGTTVIASKFYARGVRFYTDKKIVVVDSGDNYFSPHPIPYLNTQEKVLNFLSNYKEIYGIIKDSDIEILNRHIAGLYEIRILKQIGDEYIVRFERL
ncbi:MAG: glycosyltransferase family 39 protein [Candidatus Omnitrophica bacterium]|nr:glycosyltransferase family 39 protein [Candidatus Omnitrophota bacterium]